MHNGPVPLPLVNNSQMRVNVVDIQLSLIVFFSGVGKGGAGGATAPHF